MRGPTEALIARTVYILLLALFSALVYAAVRSLVHHGPYGVPT